MARRGRPRLQQQPQPEYSEISSNGTPEPETSIGSRSSRRSRVPKRYLDADYVVEEPAKRRAVRRSPSVAAEEVDLSLGTIPAKTRKSQVKPTTTPRPKGRPRKTESQKKKDAKLKKKSGETKYEDEVVYMDYESEDESSDDEFVPEDVEEQYGDEIEEELDLGNVKTEIVEEAQFCPWIDMDPASLPKLELPETSHDIPLPPSLIFDAIEIYEILRSYHRTLRLTPFTFEDFCGALISKNNSCLMSEVHISLLKICLKSDDEEQTHYSVTETNNAINIMIHHLEAMTYAEILRQYIEAYPGVDISVRDAINAENYPFVGCEPKIVVLLFMCYRFLYSSEYRKVVHNIGKFQNDDSCRVCGKSSGLVVGCTRCEASFHVDCSNLNPFPEVLVCNLCTRNQVRGVVDSMPFDETIDREPFRMQPIGKDRHGRLYWFVVRRLFVQSEDETELHIYSTPPQLYQLIQRLDESFYERDLCNFIRSKIDDFLEKMTLTVELSMERRDKQWQMMIKKGAQQYNTGYNEPTTPTLYLHKDSVKRMAGILKECAEREAVKREVKVEDDGEESNQSGPLEVKKEDAILCESMIGIYDGRLINSYWSGGATEEELVEYCVSRMEEEIDPAIYWRMGDEVNDQEFMSYHNFYAQNDMAESTQTRKKMTDRKKYMASKFSFLDNSEFTFQWQTAKERNFYGNELLHTSFVKWTISKLARKVPPELMHRLWASGAYRMFEEQLKQATSYKELARCLLKFDCAIRKTVFVPQWWNGIGQLKMERNTVEQREAQTREFKRLRNLEIDATSKELDDSYIKVNYSKPKWPNTYILRQKGETYRNAGKGVMGGWVWMSSKYYPQWTPVPNIPHPNENGVFIENNEENQKAKKLNCIINKLRKNQEEKQRISENPRLGSFMLSNSCYSPMCRSRNEQQQLVCQGSAIKQACYATNCRSGQNRRNKAIHDKKHHKFAGTVGVDLPWPIPKIHNFRSKNGKSIFVVEKKIIRQIVKSAGRVQIYIPGFSTTAKSNPLVWNYPAPRPCLDLCWRWMTLNSISLHAVALQLKVLWSSIRWNEWDPDDTHPDRRVVIDTPTHDERRRIIEHKEMGPFGQYERYRLEIEIIPLYEEPEDEEESWTSRRDIAPARTSTRKRRNGLRTQRTPKAHRFEWVDGVELKVYEIKDYWHGVKVAIDKERARRKNEAMKEKQREEMMARKQELMEKRQILTQQQKLEEMRRSIPVSNSSPNIGGMSTAPPVPQRFLVSNGGANGGMAYSRPMGQRQTQLSHLPIEQRISLQQRYMTNPVVNRTPPARVIPANNDYRFQQVPSTSRVAAGTDSPVGQRYCVPGTTGSVMQQRNAPSMRYISTNGMPYSEPRPMQQGYPQGYGQVRRVVMRPVGEPQLDMRRAVMQPNASGGVAEEAVAANMNDGDEQPPIIPRYEHSVDQSEMRPAPVRQVYAVNPQGSGGIRRSIPANAVLLIKRPDGTQNSVTLKSGQRMPDSQGPPGTVFQGGPSRIMPARPAAHLQQPQQYRQMVLPGNGTTRIVRMPQQLQSQMAQRRVLPPQRQQMDFDVAQQDMMPQRQYVVSATNQLQRAKAPPRGGTTMQMAQQQQMVIQPEQHYMHYEDDPNIQDVPFEHHDDEA